MAQPIWSFLRSPWCQSGCIRGPQRGCRVGSPVRRAMHPRWRRCSALKYIRYSRLSRLARGSPVSVPRQTCTTGCSGNIRRFAAPAVRWAVGPRRLLQEVNRNLVPQIGARGRCIGDDRCLEVMQLIAGADLPRGRGRCRDRIGQTPRRVRRAASSPRGPASQRFSLPFGPRLSDWPPQRGRRH